VAVAEDGTVEIAAPVTIATIGLLDETHEVETLSFVAQAQDGSSEGRPRRLHGATGVHLHRTAAGRVTAVERTFGEGPEVLGFEDLVPLQVASDLVSAYSGVTKVSVPSGHADAVSMRFKPYGGAPMTVLAIAPNVEEVGA
jgi:hypothetical protein